jgi:hypothetical protein
MRDFRDAKAMAQTLRAALTAMGFKITVSQSLELIAKAFGAADWNTLSALIGAQSLLSAHVGKVKQAPAAPENASGPVSTVESPKIPGNLLSGELESTLNQAFVYAKQRRHDMITVEHLLLLLLDNADAAGAMKGSGVNIDDLRKKLTDYIDKIQATEGAGNPKPTLEFQRVLQRAIFHAQSASRLPIKSLNVLVAVFSQEETHAVKLLNEQGVTRLDVVRHIGFGTTKEGGGPANSPDPT